MTAVGQKAYGGGTGLNVIEERLAVQDVIVLEEDCGTRQGMV